MNQAHDVLLLTLVRLSLSALCNMHAEVAGLRRKLELYLSPESELLRSPWDIGECVGCWSRPNFDTVFYPYNPPHITRPKEVKKLFMVQLPENTYFGVSFICYLLCNTCCNSYKNEF
jgi:cleavage and polyadenylation specificity factor subunit 5